MAALFRTCGPFIYGSPRHLPDRVRLKAFWKAVDAAQEGLSQAFGVYVVAIGEGRGQRPIYIGQSNTGFRKRLSVVHHVYKLAQKQYPAEILSITFLARSSKKKFLDPKKTIVELGREEFRNQVKVLKSVDRLEFLLIGSCIQKGIPLLNTKEKSFFGGLVVPGYLNYDNLDRTPEVRAFERLISKSKKVEG